MNPKSKEDLGRLVRKMDRDRWRDGEKRRQRTRMLEEYAGDWFGDSAATKRVYVNLLQLAGLTYQRLLVPQNPRGMITTANPSIKVTAHEMQLAANHRVSEMRLDRTLRIGALDAMFGSAVFKVALCPFDDPEIAEGFLMDAGEAYCSLISMDDWVHDTTAKRWEAIGYAGHRYVVPLEAARNNSYFNRTQRHNLRPMRRRVVDEHGGRTATSLAGHDQGRGGDDYHEDMVQLWEVWLPRDNKILTLPADDQGKAVGEVLREAEWYGPECGPYHPLSFIDVPDQVLGAAPMGALMNLHLLANSLYRKAAYQASRQKTFLAYRGASTESAENIRKTDDGGCALVEDPEALQEMSTGGVNRENFLFFMQAKQLFSEQAGNIHALAGLGQQAGTATQEEMIHQNASGLVQEMQFRMLDVAESIYGSLCWYWWTDPISEYEVKRKIPNTRFDFTSRITPEMREADVLDLNFQIDVYSMQPSTPGQKLQGLLTILNQVIAPYLPQIQEQQMGIAWDNLLRRVAEYMDQPDLEEIMTFAGPPQRGNEMIEEAPRRSPVTTRNYVRHNASQQTQPGFEQALMQHLAGGGQGGQGQSMGPMMGLMGTGF